MSGKSEQGSSSQGPTKKPSSRKKKDSSFKFVDMTTEWEPGMSVIRKEKKYFQLRKQLQGCENFQHNYFVISMPKKKKRSANGEEVDDSEEEDNQPNQNTSSNNVPMPSPSLPPSNNNPQLMNTSQILTFENYTGTPSLNLSNTKKPPSIVQLPNGLIQYNNIQISTSETPTDIPQAKAKRKAKKQTPEAYNPNVTPVLYPMDNDGKTKKRKLQQNSSESVILSAQHINIIPPNNFENSSRIIDASVVPLSPLMLSGEEPEPELDTLSICFSDSEVVNPLDFQDFPDIELFGGYDSDQMTHPSFLHNHQQE